jgi:hypothetical protein
VARLYLTESGRGGVCEINGAETCFYSIHLHTLALDNGNNIFEIRIHQSAQTIGKRKPV